MAQVINPQIGQKDDMLGTALKGLQVTDSVYGIMTKRAALAASSPSGVSTPSSTDADAMARRLYSTQSRSN